VADDLTRRVTARLAAEAGRPTPMGALVDALVAEGATPEAVERAVWTLLASGRVVLAGFLARKVRRADARGARSIHHTYEPLLAPADDA